MKIGNTLKGLTLLLCLSINEASYSNGCSGSTFTTTYEPKCGCWQVCNVFITDCPSLTDLTWDFGDGTTYSSLTDYPCHHYSQPGTYMVSFRVQGFCHSPFAMVTCMTTQTLVVDTVNNYTELNADFTYNFSCYRSQVLFQSSVLPSVGPYIFSWDFGDGATSAVSSPAHVFPDCGVYNVKLIVTRQSCCSIVDSDTIEKTISIDCVTDSNLFSASISVITPLTCTGSDAALQVSATGGFPPYSYLWSTGDSTGTITGLSYGTYTLTISDSTGCYNILSRVVPRPRCTLVAHPVFIRFPVPWW